MTYTVIYHPSVVREDIPSIGKSDRARIKQAIEEKLTTQPDLYGTPLRQSLTGHRKLRVGDYRVIFRLKGTDVIIVYIQHRSVVYKPPYART